MTKIKRILSLILSFIIAFSAAFTVYAEESLTVSEEITSEADTGIDSAVSEEINHFDEIEIGSKEEYKEYLLKFSRPTFSTEQYLKLIKIINFVTKFLTGRVFFPDEYFNITVDAFTQELSNHIVEVSGIDLVAVATHLPDVSKPVDVVTSVLNLNTTEIRNTFYEKRDELLNNGDDLMGYLYHFFGIYFSVIDEIEIYSAPVESRENTTELIMRFHFKDGATEDFYPGVYINTETGEFTNRDNSGMFGSGFNFSLNEAITYATVDCWMRDFGFCVFYDIAANSMPLLFRYSTRRFHFDYNGLEWMIQIWKGNYVVANGGEVGLYNRDPDNKFGTFYNCANNEQMLEMSMQIYAGDKLLVNRPQQMHWWINGFHLSKTTYLPASLTMKFSIIMADEEMLRAFCESIDKNIMKDVSYRVEGLKITVIW